MGRRLKALLVRLALAGALTLSLSACSDETTMPDLSGMRKDEAAATLREHGIDDWTEKWSEGPNPLVVVDQVPDPGETVDEDTEVEISLSGN